MDKQERDSKILDITKVIEKAILSGDTYTRNFECRSELDVNKSNIFSLIGWYDLDSECQKVIDNDNLLVEMVYLVAGKIAEDEVDSIIDNEDGWK